MLAFSKLKSVYKQNTGNTFEDTDFESFGIINEKGELTNAGALIADECPLRHSRVFCTRWNGLTKASGVVDAIDDSEYSGSIILLLQEAYKCMEIKGADGAIHNVASNSKGDLGVALGAVGTGLSILNGAGGLFGMGMGMRGMYGGQGCSGCQIVKQINVIYYG